MKRHDGRAPEQLRDINIQVGVLKNADGSCYLEWGKNKIMAAVYGPRPSMGRWDYNPFRAVLNFRYNMAPFSVEERKRPGPDRRSIEISKVLREALEKIVFLDYFPRTRIDVFVEVLQADAGTRCASLTAASLALADAGIPMKGIVAACALGRIDGTIVYDLDKTEEELTDFDLPVGILGHNEHVVLLQMDGKVSVDDLKEILKKAIEANKIVYEKQKEALRRKFGEVNGTE